MLFKTFVLKSFDSFFSCVLLDFLTKPSRFNHKNVKNKHLLNIQID